MNSYKKHILVYIFVSPCIFLIACGSSQLKNENYAAAYEENHNKYFSDLTHDSPYFYNWIYRQSAPMVERHVGRSQAGYRIRPWVGSKPSFPFEYDDDDNDDKKH
jgi:hypothetical protein